MYTHPHKTINNALIILEWKVSHACRLLSACSLVLFLCLSLSVIWRACKNIVVFLQQRNNIHRERRPCKQPESRPMQRAETASLFFCENETPDIKIKTTGNALCIALAILPKGHNKEKNEGKGMSLPRCGKMDAGHCFDVGVRLFGFGFFCSQRAKNKRELGHASFMKFDRREHPSKPLPSVDVPPSFLSVFVHVLSFLPSLFPFLLLHAPRPFNFLSSILITNCEGMPKITHESKPFAQAHTQPFVWWLFYEKWQLTPRKNQNWCAEENQKRCFSF